MGDEEFTAGEKTIIRNQRLMMLALANISANAGGMGFGFHQEKLTSRVKQMERVWDWIAPPSERLTQ